MDGSFHGGPAGPLSASAAGITIANVTSTGASTSTLIDGDVLTVDLVVSNDTNIDFYGIGLGASGYDTDGNGIAGEGLSLAGFQVTSSLFNTAVLAGPSVFGGLSNAGAPGGEERGREEIPGFPLPQPAIPVHLALFEGVAVTPSNGDGSLDIGIGGGLTGGGDVHFQIQFLATGGDVDGIQQQFTLNFGTFLEGGLGTVGNGGSSIAFSNASLDLRVIPEPGTAVLFGPGLAGLASGRRRSAN